MKWCLFLCDGGGDDESVGECGKKEWSFILTAKSRLIYVKALSFFALRFFLFSLFFFLVGLVGCFVALLVCRRYANRFGIFFLLWATVTATLGHPAARCANFFIFFFFHRTLFFFFLFFFSWPQGVPLCVCASCNICSTAHRPWPPLSTSCWFLPPQYHMDCRQSLPCSI